MCSLKILISAFSWIQNFQNPSRIDKVMAIQRFFNLSTCFFFFFPFSFPTTLSALYGSMIEIQNSGLKCLPHMGFGLKCWMNVWWTIYFILIQIKHFSFIFKISFLILFFSLSQFGSIYEHSIWFYDTNS